MFNIYQINKLKKSYDWSEEMCNKDTSFPDTFSDRPKTTPYSTTGRNQRLSVESLTGQ